MGVHGNPWHAIFTILWFEMLYFYPLKLVGRIGMQQWSRYHLFLNNTLIMIVNVSYCVQVRFFGQVVGMHISCIWMSLFKWDEYFYRVVCRHAAWIYCEGMQFLHKTTTETKDANHNIQQELCWTERKIGDGVECVQKCVLCAWPLSSQVYSSLQPFAGVSVRIKLDLIWIWPLGSTSRRLLRCSMNVI